MPPRLDTMLWDVVVNRRYVNRIRWGSPFGLPHRASPGAGPRDRVRAVPRLCVFALAAVAAAAIAGCGGGGSPSSSTTSSTTTSSTTTASTASTLTQTLGTTTASTTTTLSLPSTTTTSASTATTSTRTTRPTTSGTTRTRPAPGGQARAQLGMALCERNVAQSNVLSAAERSQLDSLCRLAWSGHLTPSSFAAANRRLCVTMVRDSGLVGAAATAAAQTCENR